MELEAINFTILIRPDVANIYEILINKNIKSVMLHSKTIDHTVKTLYLHNFSNCIEHGSPETLKKRSHRQTPIIHQ